MKRINPKSELLNIHPVRYAPNLFLKHIELLRYFSVYISNNLFYLTGQANSNDQNLNFPNEKVLNPARL